MNGKVVNKLVLNSSSAMLYQVVSTICGFILPRFILAAYGSVVNGLVSSIMQFLSFITFMEFGIGAVVQSSLYKPLAEKDDDGISRIIKSASSFFRKIALVLLVYVIVMMVFYPIKQIDTFGFFFTSSLIAIISISYFFEYYFGIVNQLLVSADQKSYVYLFIQSFAIACNTLICVILIKKGLSIHTVKLVTAVFYSVRPIFLYYYVKKHYCINKEIEYSVEPIKQKWNGLAQHIASVVLTSTDIVVLTLFSTLESVSIYSIYALVTNGIKQMVSSFTTGMMSYFGELIAKDRIQELNTKFDYIEWLIHFVIVLLFGCTSVLIVPFVQVYTKGVNDANYVTPIFAYILTFSAAAHSLRVPYNMIVMAAGHFKETQWSAIIETVLNITISVILVKYFGLVGVAIGTLVSMSYRTVYFVLYLNKHIVYRKILIFIKHISVDILILILIANLSQRFTMNEITYFSWALLSIKVFVLSSFIAVLFNAVFYHSYIKRCLSKILRIRE